MLLLSNDVVGVVDVVAWLLCLAFLVACQILGLASTVTPAINSTLILLFVGRFRGGYCHDRPPLSFLLLRVCVGFCCSVKGFTAVVVVFDVFDVFDVLGVFCFPSPIIICMGVFCFSFSFLFLGGFC